MINLGSEVETPFYDWSDFLIEASSWNEFPTPNDPKSKYKFASLAFKHGKCLVAIDRQTYSLLDWLGDWGGLMDALFMIAEVIIAPL